MTIPSTMLTDEEKRVIRDNAPTLSDRQGVDLPTKLDEFAESVKTEVEANDTELAGLVSGKAEIESGNDAITVSAATLGGSYGGSPVVAQLMESDGSLYVLSAAWSTDDLVITISGNATGDRTVGFFIDAR